MKRTDDQRRAALVRIVARVAKLDQHKEQTIADRTKYKRKLKHVKKQGETYDETDY